MPTSGLLQMISESDIEWCARCATRTLVLKGVNCQVCYEDVSSPRG